MKQRKLLSFLLVMAMIMTMGIFAGNVSALTEAQEKAMDDNYEAHNIWYDEDEHEGIPAASFVNGRAKDAKTGSGETLAYTPAAAGYTNTEDDYYIDLANEKIMPDPDMDADAPKAAFISYDGSKWSAVSIPATGLDISKALKKATTIQLATAYDKKAKATPAYEAGNATDGTDGAAGASVWTFPSIAARPKIAKFAINYFKWLEEGDGEDMWTLDYEGGVGLLNIAVTTDGKKPDAAGWGTFPVYDGEEEGGILVQPMKAGKAVKTLYVLRVAPNFEEGSYAPGSAPKKLSAGGYNKPTGFKIDYKKEVIKGKVGVQWRQSTSVTRDSAGKITNVTWKEFDTAVRTKTMTSKDDSLVKGEDFQYDTVYQFRTVPTEGKGAKKAASEWQTVTVAKQTALTVSDVLGKIKVEKGKVVLTDKNVEFLVNADTNKWGSKPAKGATAAFARIKSTAKYDSKTDKTANQTSSNWLPIVFIEGVIDPKAKNPKQGLVDKTIDFATAVLTGSEVLFIKDNGADLEDLLDKDIGEDDVIAAFNLAYNANLILDNTDIIDEDNYALNSLSGAGAATLAMGGLDINIGAPGAKNATTGTVLVPVTVTLSDAALKSKFVPGDVLVDIKKFSTTTLADYKLYSDKAGIALVSSPLPVKFPDKSGGSPAENEVKLVLDEGSEPNTTKLTFTIDGTDPTWALGDLEYAISTAKPGASPSNMGTVAAEVDEVEAVAANKVWIRVSADAMNFSGKYDANSASDWIDFGEIGAANIKADEATAAAAATLFSGDMEAGTIVITLNKATFKPASGGTIGTAFTVSPGTGLSLDGATYTTSSNDTVATITLGAQVLTAGNYTITAKSAGLDGHDDLAATVTVKAAQTLAIDLTTNAITCAAEPIGTISSFTIGGTAFTASDYTLTSGKVEFTVAGLAKLAGLTVATHDVIIMAGAEKYTGSITVAANSVTLTGVSAANWNTNGIYSNAASNTSDFLVVITGESVVYIGTGKGNAQGGIGLAPAKTFTVGNSAIAYKVTGSTIEKAAAAPVACT